MACAGTLCLAGYIVVYATGLAPRPVRSDGFSYFVYLPSWFLFHDTTLASVARDCCGGDFPDYTAIERWPGTRRWVNAHPIGAAIMQIPAFLAAHALTRWSNLTPDGFSLYYQHGAGLAGLAWIVAGLWVLRGLLLRHFGDAVTAATLLTLLLGTNLLHYATFDSSYSHPYSFFLLAAFLALTERWYREPSRQVSVLLGVVAGLIVLTRHTNAMFLLLFPFYGMPVTTDFRTRARVLASNVRELAVMAGVGFVVLAPQLALYYQATGRLLVSSYGEQAFYFGSPQIHGVLLSARKGLFFWSPVLLLAVAGMGLLLRSPNLSRAFVVPGAVVLAIHTYIIASWWDWQFGGSYGHRGFVDTLPLFAVGLAGFLAWAARRRSTLFAAAAVCALCCALSVFQMLQYWRRIIPFNDMTWEHYTSIFLVWR